MSLDDGREWFPERVLRSATHTLNNRLAVLSGIREELAAGAPPGEMAAALGAEVERLLALARALRTSVADGEVEESLDPAEVVASAAELWRVMSPASAMRGISGSAPLVRGVRWRLVREVVALLRDVTSGGGAGNSGGSVSIALGGDEREASIVVHGAEGESRELRLESLRERRRRDGQAT